MTIGRRNITDLLSRIRQDSRTVNELRPPRRRWGVSRPSQARHLSRLGLGDVARERGQFGDERRFLGPTPMERPAFQQWTPAGFELSNEELYDIRQRLHSAEGFPAAEWAALSPPIQENLLQVGRGKSEGIQRLVGDKVRAISQKPAPKEIVLPEWTRPIQEVGRGLTELASYPLVTVGGVDISAADIVGIGLLGYAAYQGGRVLLPRARTLAEKVAYRRSPLYKQLSDAGGKTSKMGPEFYDVSRRLFKARNQPANVQQRLLDEAFRTTAKWRQQGSALERAIVEPLYRRLLEYRETGARPPGPTPQPAGVRAPIVPRATQTGAMAMGGLPSPLSPIPQNPAQVGAAIASQTGLRYDGVQETIGLQFTDVQGTGTTFYGNTLQEVQTRLEQTRKAFALAPEAVAPEAVPPTEPIVEKWQTAKSRNSTVAQRDLDTLEGTSSR